MTEVSGPVANPITTLTALELRGRIAAGELTATDVAEALLAHIAAREPEIRAWAWHDAAHVSSQAASLDAWQRAGRPLGPLHGVPVGLKDIIDTRDIPTELGCGNTAGRVPTSDAAVVERLYAAGALIMGKTVTTELAFMHPGPTRNPLNIGHTPGGSSSGSAAAVAAGMVPLAVGTQTGGSVTRPAAYCGIVGFKPSFGMIPRRGVLTQSPSLDTVGVFARNVPDAALLADVLSGADPSDPATRDAAPSRLLDGLQGQSDAPLRLACVKLPGVEDTHHRELSAALDCLDGRAFDIVECALPAIFDEVAAWRERINFAEMAFHYRWLEERGADALSQKTRQAMSAGNETRAVEFLEAINAMASAEKALVEKLGAYDAILSTATAGRAPEGLESTGTAICNGLWTYVGAPTANVPIPGSEVADLPISVQVSAGRRKDTDAVRAAHRLAAGFHGLAPQQKS